MRKRRTPREVAADKTVDELFSGVGDGMPPSPPSAPKRKRRKKAAKKVFSMVGLEIAPRDAPMSEKQAKIDELSGELEKVLEGAENAEKPPLPFTGEIPKLPADYARIVEHTFDIDPWVEYEAARNELDIGDQHVVDGIVKEEIDRAEHRALRANQLFLNAKLVKGRFERDQAIVRSAMWDEATATLQKEKDAKIRNKSITNDDVRYKAMQMFPDEWVACEDSLAQAELMVDRLEALWTLWESRCVSLRKMKDSR